MQCTTIGPERAGESFNKAQKSHDIGEQALDTILKMGILVIYYDPDDEEDDSYKLVDEFESLLATTPKRIAVDDYIDSCRYATMEIPIDWEALFDNDDDKKDTDENIKEGSPEAERARDYWEKKEDEEQDKSHYDAEFDEINGLLDQ